MNSYTPSRKSFVGTVTRDKNDKTIVVQYSWSQKHPIYKKSFRRRTRMVVHDEHNSAKINDLVLVEQCRPLSATKRWRLAKILNVSEDISTK